MYSGQHFAISQCFVLSFNVLHLNLLGGWLLVIVVLGLTLDGDICNGLLLYDLALRLVLVKLGGALLG